MKPVGSSGGMTMAQRPTRRMPTIWGARWLMCAVVTLAAALGPVAPAGHAQAPGPAWSLYVDGVDRAAPGSEFTYRIAPRNVGDVANDPTGVLNATLPTGVTGVSIASQLPLPSLISWICTDPAGASSVQCTQTGPLAAAEPGRRPLEELVLRVAVDPGASGPLTSTFEMSGGGVAEPDGETSTFLASATPDFELKGFDGEVSDETGAAYTQAAGHPASASVTFELNRSMTRDGFRIADGGDLRDAQVDLPPGIIGNPTAVPACPANLKIPSNLQALADSFESNDFCPLNSIVGTAEIKAGTNQRSVERYVAPVFNMRPPPGVAARFGFSIIDNRALLDASVRTDGDHGVRITTRYASQARPVLGSKVTLWGVPADHSHDSWRCMAFTNPTPSGGDNKLFQEDLPLPECVDPLDLNRPWLLPNPANSPANAFLTNPTACTPSGTGLTTSIWLESWMPGVEPETGSFVSHLPPGYPLPPAEWGAPQGPTGCEKVPFDPSFRVDAQGKKADSPSGLTVELGLPQDGLENPDGLATGHLKRATVTLPDGWSVSPSAADGLVGCSDAQSRVGTLLGSACPEASKIGTVEATTPLLEETLSGGVYVGTQESDDPLSGKMFRMFIALNSEERGVRVKLPGQIRIPPNGGRIETTFDNNPQVPVSKIELKLKGGPRAPLATPFDCGTKTATAALESWSGATVVRGSDLTIDCPGVGPLQPSFNAGVTSNLAGRHSTFMLRAERPDGQQVMNGLALRMPTGLLAKLKGVPRCSSGDADAGACPEASRVGTATVGAGPGPNPFFLQGGVYLTDPYKAAPFGLAVVVRAKAGPFDLGTVVVRQQLLVDPVDAHVDVVSDPLPTVLKGVPIRLRSLNVDVDRKDFVLNPTSCAAKSLLATFASPGGSVFTASAPFGAANCASLPLKPKLKLALTGKGQTTVNKHPGVKATVTQRRGDANLKRVQVKLPLSLALDPDNAQALCEFKDGTKVDPTCPKGSIVGRAKAVTPILNEPLSAPVYFVKNVRIDPKTKRQIRTLPMLIIPLRGENGIKLNLKGTSKVSDDHLVNTFEAIPDAPVSRFDLTINGGKNGILVSNGNLCRKKQVADVDIDGQNNKRSDRNTTFSTSACKSSRSKRRR